MSVRWIVAAIVAATSALCGCALAGAAVRRARVLAEYLQGVRALRVQIVPLLEPLENALRQTGLPVFQQTAQNLSPTVNVHDAWKSVVSAQRVRGREMDCLSDQDLQPLDRMFALLGSCGRESQDEALRACAEAMENICIQAQERSAQVARLYTSMGFLLGLSIVILLL